MHRPNWHHAIPGFDALARVRQSGIANLPLSKLARVLALILQAFEAFYIFTL
jgi:hypothetical protein